MRLKSLIDQYQVHVSEVHTRILTVSTYINREIDGIGGICIGVPARICRTGVYPVAIHVATEESTAFRQSVAQVKAAKEDIMKELSKTISIE
jgi:malate dehydrogenase